MIVFQDGGAPTRHSRAQLAFTEARESAKLDTSIGEKSKKEKNASLHRFSEHPF